MTATVVFASAFTFAPTEDRDLIRMVVTHPAVYKHVSDDFSPPPEEYEPHPGMQYVSVWDKGELLGMWIFQPHNAVCYEVHTCLLPCAWGERGQRAAREMAHWIFAHTPCKRIITNVPVSNRLALRFARAAGMTEFGVNKRSIAKGGQLEDQILLGLSPEEVQ